MQKTRFFETKCIFLDYEDIYKFACVLEENIEWSLNFCLKKNETVLKRICETVFVKILLIGCFYLFIYPQKQLSRLFTHARAVMIADTQTKYRYKMMMRIKRFFLKRKKSLQP